ncbi:type II toxin-antitoxin system RelE/ParE family toxin [Pedobacter cryophilus]|uniref:Type II toxin-antitoxin system RelE/ParE family toxin n=1 Tax=Pedobacter cryophilus TaxID=2571271 RepID=A0A4V5P036_9SPHI|nr:type II toxin-antitoxin system RelE/ParE family toxin [Pedobacter cryophilus]
MIFKESFLNRLKSQIHYISLDSNNRAIKFKKDLFLKIREIPTKPYSFRKSIYFEDELIRDLIFKGYTIVFRINNQTIEVFGLINYHENLND